MSALAKLVAKRSLALAQAMARPYSEGNMNSLVVISRHGGWDDEAGEYLPQSSSTPIYDDPDFPGLGAPAGVTPTSGPITFGFGDEPEYQDSVDVYIPKSAQLPRIGDKVKVTAGPDPQFIHREYKVISVIGSGRLVPSIHLRCTGAAPSRTTES